MKRRSLRILATGAITTTLLVAGSVNFASAAAKKGAACKAAGAVEGKFTCTTVGRKKTWQATPVAAPTSAAPAAAAGAAPAAAPAGLANVPGFDGKTISLAHLGNVAAGPFAVGGKALTAGFNSYINDYNDKGGVAGKYKINPIFVETEYSPDLASQKYAQLKDKVVMVSQIYGTPLVVALATKLDQDNMIGSPISLDVQWARDASYLPIGGGYQYHAIDVIDWAVNQAGAAGGKAKKYCAVAHTGPYGDAGMGGYDFAVKALGLTTGPTVRIAGAEANMAKLLAADAAWEAANATMQTFGGFAFASEYDIERKFRETRLYQVAPISTNLVLSYVAQHILGLPRSY